MFRQLDMREAMLSTAVQRSLLYDSQRQMRFLDIVEVPSEEVLAQRKVYKVKGRGKKLQLGKQPPPKDPFIQISAGGQECSMPVCTEQFFQDKQRMGPIKPYSDTWDDVQPLQLVEHMMAGMNRKGDTLEMVLNPDTDLGDCLEALMAQNSKESSHIGRRINEAMITIATEYEEACEVQQLAIELDKLGQKLGICSKFSSELLERSKESKQKAQKTQKTQEPQDLKKTQKQTPSNGENKEKNSKQRILKGNKGFCTEVAKELRSAETLKEPNNLSVEKEIVQPKALNFKKDTANGKDDAKDISSQIELKPKEVAADFGTNKVNPKIPRFTDSFTNTDLADCFERLLAQKSKECDDIRRRINEAKLTFATEHKDACGVQKLAIELDKLANKLGICSKFSSELLEVCKGEKQKTQELEKTQKQTPSNGDNKKNKPNKRIRKRNKGFKKGEETALGLPDSEDMTAEEALKITKPNSENALKIDARDDQSLDTKGSVEPGINHFIEVAKELPSDETFKKPINLPVKKKIVQPNNLDFKKDTANGKDDAKDISSQIELKPKEVEDADFGPAEDVPQKTFTVIQNIKTPSSQMILQENAPNRDNKKNKPNKRIRKRNKEYLANKKTEEQAPMDTNKKTLDTGGSGEPELKPIYKAPNEIGAGDDTKDNQLQQEQVLSPEIKLHPAEENQ